MSNGFEKHGIAHLSASSLNLWAAEPAVWAMERLPYGYDRYRVCVRRNGSKDRG